jgi:hypothetical protein
MSEEKILEAGTRIQFIEEITEDADGDHPEFLLASKGEKGTVVRKVHRGRYVVKADGWDAPFGATHGTEFVVAKEDQTP